MIVCAGDIEQFPFATPVGIGLIDSSINLTRLCLMSPPEYILFVGTAGSYGKIGLLEIIESKSACNIEQAFFLGNGYTPIDNMVSSAEDVSRETIINSSNYICTNDDISKLYIDHNIDLENMEFFSVIKVAQEFGIPVGGLFVTTNYCNPQAHEDFKKNHNEAMALLSQEIKRRVGDNL